MGRFITEDPIKDGTNWYVYCMNNPLTFIDPTGLYIGAIHSQQFQNVGVNNNAHMSSKPTIGWSPNRGWHTNTVGLYGCLLTGVVNIANSHNNEKKAKEESIYSVHPEDISNDNDHVVADIAKDDSNFIIYDADIEHTIMDYGTFNFANVNVDMSSSTIEKALEKMTGENWSVTSNISDKTTMRSLVSQISKDKDSTSYILAKINKHWVHITGYDKEKDTYSIKQTRDGSSEKDIDANSVSLMKVATNVSNNGKPKSESNSNNTTSKPQAPKPHPFSPGSKDRSGDK